MYLGWLVVMNVASNGHRLLMAKYLPVKLHIGLIGIGNRIGSNHLALCADGLRDVLVPVLQCAADMVRVLLLAPHHLSPPPPASAGSACDSHLAIVVFWLRDERQP